MTLPLGPSDRIQSLQRAAAILAAVGKARQGRTINELTARLGLTQTIVRRQVLTLAASGYLERYDRDGRSGSRWILGPAIDARAQERARQPKTLPQGATD